MAIPYMDYNLCRLYFIIFLDPHYSFGGEGEGIKDLCALCFTLAMLCPIMAGHVSAPPYYLIYL